MPTPLNESRDPDLQYIEATARQIAAVLRPGQLVVLESTTYPGTTRDVVLPILETRADGGPGLLPRLQPRARRPGQSRYSATIPKVVGGIDPQAASWPSCSTARPWSGSCRFQLRGGRGVQNPREHLSRGEHRAGQRVEDALRPMGIDVWEVIEAAKTKPFGFQAFYPGPGLGGHCIPIDPFYLTWCREHGMPTRFIELAGEINTQMPQYVVHRVIDALNDAGKPLKGSRFACSAWRTRRTSTTRGKARRSS